MEVPDLFVYLFSAFKNFMILTIQFWVHYPFFFLILFLFPLNLKVTYIFFVYIYLA